MVACRVMIVVVVVVIVCICGDDSEVMKVGCIYGVTKDGVGVMLVDVMLVVMMMAVV